MGGGGWVQRTPPPPPPPPSSCPKAHKRLDRLRVKHAGKKKLEISGVRHNRRCTKHHVFYLKLIFKYITGEREGTVVNFILFGSLSVAGQAHVYKNFPTCFIYSGIPV